MSLVSLLALSFFFFFLIFKTLGCYKETHLWNGDIKVKVSHLGNEWPGFELRSVASRAQALNQSCSLERKEAKRKPAFSLMHCIHSTGFLAVRPRASPLTSWCLSFLISKMQIIIEWFLSKKWDGLRFNQGPSTELSAQQRSARIAVISGHRYKHCYPHKVSSFEYKANRQEKTMKHMRVNWGGQGNSLSLGGEGAAAPGRTPRDQPAAPTTLTLAPFFFLPGTGSG